MTDQVKNIIRQHLETIGPVSCKENPEIISYVKLLIKILTEIESRVSFETMRSLYPMIGQNPTPGSWNLKNPNC